jgi:hypothetical protein
MQRIARATLSLCGLAATVLFLVAPLARAQEAGEEPPEIMAVVGVPFSAVSIQENIRVTPDGNRFIRKITNHHYRDGQGRTRLDREIPLQASVSHATAGGPHVMVTINNKVTGEIDMLFPDGKVASVMQRSGRKVIDVPAAQPEVFTWFSNVRIGPNEPGWSAPVSLGEKSIEGLHAVGSQRTYTLAAGAVGNEKPVIITVEQWSSPDLGLILMKTSRASTGGEVRYSLQQIVQAEPDADLFMVPADYRKIVVKSGSGSVTSAQSTNSSATVVQQ